MPKQNNDWEKKFELDCIDWIKTYPRFEVKVSKIKSFILSEMTKAKEEAVEEYKRKVVK
jgi:hypothetical protein